MRVILDAGVENQPPVAVANAYSVAENTVLTVAAPGVLGNDTDADGDTLTAVRVDEPEQGTLTLNADGSFTYTPDSHFNGTDQFTYEVSDGELTSNTATVTLTVSTGTNPPVARDDTYSATEETALMVSAPGVLANDTDADNDTLTAVLVDEPEQGTLTLNADGSFTYTPGPDFNGIDSFTYEASDGALTSNVATVTISVSTVNDPPEANAGPDQTVNEGSAVALDGSGSRDLDGDALTYQWRQTAGPPVSLNLQDPAHPTFAAPAVSSAGALLTFELTVSDGSSTSEPDTVDITVLNVNNRPIANAGPDQTVNEGTLVTLDGSGSSDPEGEPLTTYQWTQVAGPDVSLTAADSAHPTFTAPTVPSGGAILTFELTVSDGSSTSAPNSVNITVTDVNHAPVADAGDDQTVNEGAEVMLDGRGSLDPDNDSLTYRWAQLAGPPVTLSDSTSSTPRFSAPLVGPVAQTLTFELSVSDGLASADDTVDVVVENVNHAPTANAGADQTVNEGIVVTLNGTASSDPDSDPLSYAWRQIGSGTKVTLSGAATATPTFTAPLQPSHAQETLSFELVVEDGLGGTASDSVSVTVQDVDAPPACGLAQANPAVLSPPDGKMVSVAIVGVTDPDNDRVTLTVTGVTQDEPVISAEGGDMSPDAVLQQGSTVLLRRERANKGNGRVYRVSFTARDDFGGSCTGAVTVCVPKNKQATCTDSGQLYDSIQR
jgi:VCBS repeat-containing protein